METKMPPAEWTPPRKCGGRRERKNGIERSGVPSRRWDALLTALYSATAIVGVLLVARLFVACLFYVYYGVWPCSL